MSFIDTKEISNWLNQDLNKFLENIYLFHTPHFFGERSSNSNIHYFCNLNDDNITKYLAYKITQTIKKNLLFKRIYINVQHPNMDGDFHTDGDSDITSLYMVTGDGDFEIKNEGKYKFEKNKLIMFDAKKEHRGLAPSKGVRITLAFKAKIK
jgi:hypothetical protein